eukprot:826438-Rhodomonas_salina.1
MSRIEQGKTSSLSSLAFAVSLLKQQIWTAHEQTAGRNRSPKSQYSPEQVAIESGQQGKDESELLALIKDAQRK